MIRSRVWPVAATLGLIVALPASEPAPPVLEARARTIVSDGFRTPPVDLETPVEFTIATTSPDVEFVRIPLPNTPADPWSHWGVGVIHSNGRFYLAVGDHRGIDASTYLYEYDPQTRMIRKVADVLSAVEGYQAGDFGYGKMHGRLNEGKDGQIYFATYWGQWKKGNARFEGDRILRYDQQTQMLTDLGMPLFGWGYPSTHMAEEHLLFYAEAHKRKFNSRGDVSRDYLAQGYEDPNGPYQIEFLVYDIVQGRIIFRGGHDGLAYGRDFFVDGAGNAYFNNGGGGLAKYDRRRNTVEPVKRLMMPAEKLRRTIGPDDHGVHYGTTHEKLSRLFSVNFESGDVRVITTTWGNTAAVDVTRDGRFAYFVPGSHGSMGKGRPLIQVDIATGRQKVIAFLAQPIWEQADFHLGGTYDLNITDDGGTVYITFNGAHGEKNDWKDQAFIVVHVPASER